MWMHTFLQSSHARRIDRWLDGGLHSRIRSRTGDIACPACKPSEWRWQALRFLVFSERRHRRHIHEGFVRTCKENERNTAAMAAVG